MIQNLEAEHSVLMTKKDQKVIIFITLGSASHHGGEIEDGVLGIKAGGEVLLEYYLIIEYPSR